MDDGLMSGWMEGIRDYPAELAFAFTEFFRHGALLDLGRVIENKETLSFGKIRIHTS